MAPPRCTDPRCQRPLGHDGMHLAETRMGGCRVIDEWGDLSPTDEPRRVGVRTIVDGPTKIVSD